MKRVTIRTTRGEMITIDAPEDKNMVFDPQQLQNGILAIGEYGASGVKIGAFKEWEEAVFLDGSEGYTVTVKKAGVF